MQTMKMYPRKQLDVSWPQLMTLLGLSARDHDPDTLLTDIEQLWSDGRRVLTALSVRTGFDLLLRCLALEPGSEVIVTAVTIPHMSQILREHGLVPVPIDFDPRDMRTSAALAARAVGPKTAAIMVTHLFGTRADLSPFVRLARTHGLYLWEDCAQAFDGVGFAGDERADVSMFSFGTIKSATAFGGALLSVRDEALYLQMSEAMAHYPRQRRVEYVAKLLKYSGLVAIQTPARFGAVMRLVQAAGRDYDTLIRQLTRGFSGPGFWERIRKRPSGALLAALRQRLRAYDPERLRARGRVGRKFSALLADHVVQFGTRSPRHNYWLFPVAVANPDEVIEAARARGFDATTGSSTLVAIDADGIEDPALLPAVSAALMEHIVYLPVYAGVPDHELAALAEAINHVARALEVPTSPTLLSVSEDPRAAEPEPAALEAVGS